MEEIDIDFVPTDADWPEDPPEPVRQCAGYSSGNYCYECERCLADDERGDVEGKEARSC